MREDIDRRRANARLTASSGRIRRLCAHLPLTAAALLAAAALAMAPAARANPAGGQVTAGSATIATVSPNQLDIVQSTNRAVIDWKSFDIATGQQTLFQQPSSAAITLNQINAANPSVIAGSLTANGSLVLVNPNGMVFTKGAQVNVNSLIATPSAINNAAFMAGGSKLRFNRPSANPNARIVNEGTITVAQKGLAALVAPSVANSGVITANLGHVVLAGASTYTIDFYGDGLLNFAIGSKLKTAPLDANGKPVASLVSNTGEIDAPGGTVLLTANAAAGILANVIDASGEINAPTASDGAGAVTIDAGAGNRARLSGSIDVSGDSPGQLGGTAIVTGGSVKLTGTAQIDADGVAGGGTVAIGGGPHGADASVRNARRTSIADGAVIDASATDTGNGGTVSVWSQHSTVLGGTIVADGGPNGGNGGWIETSGESLTVGSAATIHAAALAPTGTPGTWLLDPLNLDVVTTGAGVLTSGSGIVTITPTKTVGTVLNSTIEAALDLALTTDVILTTTGTKGGATGTITVEPGASITWASSAKLTFDAAGDIVIDAPVTGANGDLILDASTSSSGSITIAAPINVQTFSAVAGSAGTINLDNGTGTLVTTGGGGQTYSSPVVLQASANLLDTGNGAISFASTVDGASALTVNAGATGSVTFGGAVGGATPLASLSVTGTTDLNGGAVTTNGGQSYNSPVNLGETTVLTSTGGGALDLAGTVDGAFALTASSTVGTVTLGGAVGGTAPLASLNVTGTTDLNGGAVTTSGGQNYNSPVSLGATTVLTSTSGGALDLANTVDGAFALTANTTGTVTLGGAVGGATPLASLGVTGATDLNGGAVTTSGGQSYNSPITLGAPTMLTSNAGGTISFAKTVDGAFAFAANAGATGTVMLGGAVGGTAPLASLDVTGATDLNGGVVTTSGGQTFVSPVSLGALTVLTSNASSAGGSIALENPVTGGANSLTLASGSGNQTLNGITTSGDLTLKTSGTITLDAGTYTIAGGGTPYVFPAVTTNGTLALGQSTTFRALTLGSATTFDSTVGGAISFASTIDGPFALTADTSGTVTLSGVVGGVTPLASLSLTGATDLNGGTVTTSGGQSYHSPVSLGAATSVTSNDGGTISFAKTIDGAFAFVANAPVTGTVMLGGAVGGTTALAKLSVTGATDLNGGAVTTSGGQSYNSPVTLGAPTMLTSNAGGANGKIILDAEVTGGPNSLTLVSGSGNQTLNGITTSGDLTLKTSGTITLDAGTYTITGGGTPYVFPAVTTNGTLALGQPTVFGAVTLGSATTFDSTVGGAISFASTIDGPFALTADTSGAVTLGGAVGGVTPLTSLSVTGATALNGGAVTTSGGQTYNSPVTLGATTALTSTGGGALDLASTVDGPFGLTVDTTGGTLTLAGAVGGTTALAKLNVTGATELNGGAVTTSGGQTYNNPITLGAATVLTSTGSGRLDLASTVDGPFTLTAKTDGTVMLGGAVGGTTALAKLSVTGATDLNGGVVTTSGGQTYHSPITLGAATLLSSTGGGALDLASTVDGAFALTADTSGTVTFGGAVGGTTPLAKLSVTGATDLNGGAVTTSGGQSYNSPVTLGAPTMLTSNAGGANGKIILDAEVTGGPNSLTLVSGSGNQTLNGITTSGDLTLKTSGTITLDAGTYTITGGGTPYVFPAVTTNGTLALGQPTVFGAVTLGSATTFDSTVGGAISFASTIDGPFALTADTSGAVTLGGAVGGVTPLTSLSVTGATALNGGAVTTSGGQTYNSPVTLGAATALTSNAGGGLDLTSTINGAFALTADTTGTLTLGGAVGGGTALTKLNVTGATALNGGAVTTSGGQSYNSPITLGAATVLTSTGGGALDLATTVNGAFALTANTGGTVTFGGAVGGGTPLAKLNVTGATDLNGRTVTTSGGQTYHSPITLGAAMVLTSTGSGAVDLASTVDGPFALTADTSGTVTFGGAVGGTAPLVSVNVTGATDLNGGAVTTSGGQSYNSPVNLSAATILSSTGGGALDLASTINGAFALTSNTSSTVTFGGVIGRTTPLASLTASGATDINGGAVTTSGWQSYNSPITLGAATILTSTGGGALDLASTVNGAFALTANTTGTVTLGGMAGGITPLASLGVTGTTDLNGGAVTTSDGQNYNNPVTLGAATVLTSTGGGALDLASTVNGAFALTANTTGTVTFGGAVGSSTPLASLSVTGTTDLNGGAITTSGGQSYNSPITLGAATVLTSTGGALDLASTVNGAFALAANTTATVTLGDAVGGTTPLASLGVTGVTDLNGGTATTSGGQSYNSPITLGAATVLTSTGGGGLDLASTVDGPFALTANTTGPVTLGGAVGGTTPLASLSVTGMTDLNGGSATTSGGQSYNSPITLGAATVLTSTGGGMLDLASTVNGAFALTADTSGMVTLGGAVGGTTPLASLATTGATDLNGGTVTTSGGQTYNSPITLGAATTLTSSGSGALDVANTVDGPFALTANTSGTVTLGGAVGRTTPLASLSVTGVTDLNGGGVTTSGGQTYNSPITLSAATVLTSTGGGTLDLANTVNGAFALTTKTSGIVTLGGAVGSTTPLASLSVTGVTDLNSGGVTTSGGQTNNSPITLGATTVLTSTGGGALDLTSTVDGPFALSANTGGMVTLGGAVGGTAPLARLSVTGVTDLNGGAVTTSGGQSYNSPITLGAATVLTSTGGGALDLASTVNGAFALTANTGGALTLGGVVGGTTPLASLSVTGATDLNGGTVTTSGGQTYNSPVTLGATTVLTSSGGALDLASTVDGPFGLTATASSNVTFGGAVGGTAPLASLSVTGATDLNGGAVTTSGGQTYNSTVTLGAATALASTGGGTLDLASAVNGAFALAADTSGTVMLGGAVGGTTPLASVSLTGATDLNGGAVTTSGGQTYNSPITLGATTALTSTGGGALALASTVDGPFALTAKTGDTVTFGGAVGGITPLASLSVTGTTDLNGGAVTTSGGQSYNSRVNLGATTVLTSTGGGALDLASTINGAFALTTNTSGTATLGGAVGGSTPLASLSVTAGIIALDAPTTTTGSMLLDQTAPGSSFTVSEPLTTGGDILLQAPANLTLAAPVNANGGAAVLGASPGAVGLSAGTGNIVETGGGVILASALEATAFEGLIQLGGVNRIGADDVGGIAQTPGVVAGAAGRSFVLTDSNASLNTGVLSEAVGGITLPALAGVATNGGDIALQVVGSGNLSLATSVCAGVSGFNCGNAANDNAALVAAGTVGEPGGGVINAQGLIVEAGDAVMLDNAGNTVASLAGFAGAGNFQFTNGTGLTVGSLGPILGFSANGVVSSGGDIRIKTLSGNLGLTAAVCAGVAAVNCNSPPENNAALIAAGSLTEGDGGFISARGLVADAGLGISLTNGNLVGTLAGNAAGGSFDFTNAEALTINSVGPVADVAKQSGVTAAQNVELTTSAGAMNVAGNLQAGGNVLVTAASSASITGAITLTAGQNIVVATGGPFLQSGELRIAAPDFVVGTTGVNATTLLTRLLGASGAGATTITNASVITNAAFKPTGASVNPITFDGSLSAPTAVVVLLADGGIISGNGAGGPQIVVGQLGISGTTGSASLFGSIGGDATSTAAQLAKVNPTPNNHYRFNDCVVGSVTCLTLPPVTPVQPQPILNVDILVARPTQSDLDAPLIDIFDEERLCEELLRTDPGRARKVCR